MPRQESAFWHFSLRFYAEPEVSDACLQLQETCGVDINVLLYTLYLARVGRLIGSEDVAHMEALVAEWRDHVVAPLRAVRRYTKAPPAAFADAGTAALRTDVKRVELDAEHLQQLCLERNLPAPNIGTAHPEPRACAASNLAAYAKRLGCFPAAQVEVLLRRLDDI